MEFPSQANSPTVLLVGHGQFGSIHRRILEELEQEKRITLVGVVDKSPEALKNISQRAFQDLKTAITETNPDIIAVVTNTGDHARTIESALQYSEADFFIEKSFVENIEKAQQLAEQMKTRNVAFGFLIRQSPAIKSAIEYINQHHLSISSVDICWQKKRLPTRPSAGVHIDEACHSIDATLSYILPETNSCDKNSTITVNNLERTYSNEIIDVLAQQNLYGKDGLLPMAEVRYEMLVNGIQVRGLSSFLKSPQKRTITLHTKENTDLKLIFDKEINGIKGDHLHVSTNSEEFTMNYPCVNKVKKMWEEFLESRNSEQNHPSLARLDDAIRDLVITKALNREESSRI